MEQRQPPPSTAPTTTDKSNAAVTLPSKEVLRSIAARQDERAAAIRKRRREEEALKLQSEGVGEDKAGDDDDKAGEQHRRDAAAQLIQRNYRGHRDRRAMQGHGLDPGTRWLEALKEAKYHSIIEPKSRQAMGATSPGAKERWKTIGAIAHRAGSDDTSEEELEGMGEEEKEKHRRRKREQKAKREKYAKVMGLEYFLEMVDQKHRYGSSLRRYHVVWQKADTNENFFYWLDIGEGKDVDLEERPRKRLDTERVRYLSREERLKYLINIDDQGRFVYAKNGQPVTTSVGFKDSVDGIVPVDDKTPTWRELTTGSAQDSSDDSSSSDDSDDDDDSIVSGTSTGGAEDASKYTNQELHDAKGLAKINALSVNTLTNHLLRKTTKKNTWIFVADTSFRLYIGIKQSGAFQHSSFLQGARVSAAGLIKVKRGQIRKLSPLSGHYAPPVRNFREFVRTLKEHNADMSRCSISRSYAVLLGLEGYQGAKRQVKGLQQGVTDVMKPEEKKKREEALRDKSKSAQMERLVTEREEREKKQRRSMSWRLKKFLGKGDAQKSERIPEEEEMRQHLKKGSNGGQTAPAEVKSTTI